jgi:hypothetical protein
MLYSPYTRQPSFLYNKHNSMEAGSCRYKHSRVGMRFILMQPGVSHKLGRKHEITNTCSTLQYEHVKVLQRPRQSS